MAGIVLAAVGVVVLVVAVLALRDPKSTDSTAPVASQSSSVAPSSTPATSPASSPRRSASGTAPPADVGSGSATSPAAALGSAAAHAIPLVVLNNTTTSGLAAGAAQRFEDGGWTVSSQGNLTDTIISTCAYYDPSTTDAKAAAKVLQSQYPTIKRVKPRFDGLPEGPIVVVLTPDYSPN